MQKNKWNFILTDSDKPKGLASAGLPGLFITVCVVAALVGLTGFARIVYRGASYALAKYDAAEQHRENTRLKDQIENLERFVNQKTESIAELAAYEDNARLKYGMEAISGDVRKAGVGGFPTSEDMLYSSMMSDPLIQKAELLRNQVSSLSHQAELQESTFLQVTSHAKKVRSNLSKRPAIWPAAGRVTSTFGYRYHPFNGMRLMHEGIDIANSVWTPIYATADGQVSKVSSWTHFGNMVKISHGAEYLTLYAHMQKTVVTEGQIVKRGDVIGYMGNTGRSTGPHLHYEVHRSGRPINPMQFILPVDQIVD
ncbi:MAG: M23 family metallopeptidase [Chitinispirillales bacterium]|jgi:murein DD-endopeptidase MepM/ murein hydrolase activator NlpD|nr:M23 family metallopeptidase [Chitinispirillales bacterium]